MFNPLYPFTNKVLDATVERGCYYFVRNNYPAAFDHFDENIHACLLITHYDDKAKAEAHYNSIGADSYRFFYNWLDDNHKARLKKAASDPPGYKIFSAYFLPDYKQRITNPVKEKINRYMRRYTDWETGKGEKLHLDFYLQFGSLYVTMRYAGQEMKIKFFDIEKQR